jgi:Protein of unknown function (DUF1566)
LAGEGAAVGAGGGREIEEAGMDGRVILARCAAAVLALVVGGVAAAAEPSVVVEGEVESAEGGLVFPDGTAQATSAESSVPAAVADSGQRGCWAESGEGIVCNGTGQDGELQAGLALPAPRFVDAGDGTVVDRATGRVWLRDGDCSGDLTWSAALAFVAALADPQCGLADASTVGDWRLPNVNELLSLVSYGAVGPALPAGHPFLGLGVGSEAFWSSTSYQLTGTFAWAVVLDTGSNPLTPKSATGPLLAIRSGS